MTVIKDGFSQIELTRCSFLHDGNIESQCEAAGDIENGKIVVVDKANKKVYDVDADGAPTENVIYGVCYTAERNYNQFTPGRKHFITKAGECPRVGILKAGDVYATNAYLTNGTEAPKNGTVLTKGAVKLIVADNEIGTADGQTAVKYQVL
jgi:hypothetical protein